jgi:hypothetical protein
VENDRYDQTDFEEYIEEPLIDDLTGVQSSSETIRTETKRSMHKESSVRSK